MESKKHAYLILAHKNNITLLTLIKSLDNSYNDIYIHMDKKNTEYDKSSLEKIVKYSNVYNIRRTKVSWGGYSQINAELRLLEAACLNDNYKYYHLLSGEDLPIKTNDYIYSFFEKYAGCNFIRFQDNKNLFPERVSYYWLFQEYAKREYSLAYFLNYALVILQKLIRIKRNKNIIFQKGTNWFSITDELARYVLSKEDKIKKVFKYTKCCDEVFLQTLVYNSNYKNTLFHREFDNDPISIMRHIDWQRGNPYVYKLLDLDELLNSKMLWARKFDCEVDEDIVNSIYNYLRDSETQMMR